MTIHFTIPGPPVGKARPRVTRNGTYTPRKTLEYQTLVRQCARSHAPFCMDSRPLACLILAEFPVPKSYSKKKRAALIGQPYTKKPDGDNVEKAVLDACNGLLYPDDAQVYAALTLRSYAAGDGKAEVYLTDEGVNALLAPMEWYIAACPLYRAG